MDEVLKVPYKCCYFLARSAQGRIQGGAKIGHGVPFFKELLLHMFRNSNFWRVFEVYLDLVILVYFNAISIDFYAVKSFICINFV